MPRRADPLHLSATDRPAEWPNVPEELKAVLGTGQILTPRQAELWRGVLAGSWFFVANNFYDDTGRRYRCKTCRRRHLYVTMDCVEVPFNGLNEIVAWIESYDEQTKTKLYEAFTSDSIEPITPHRAYRNIARLRDRGHDVFPNIIIPASIPCRRPVVTGGR